MTPRNSSRNQAPPDMPAVSPLDLPPAEAAPVRRRIAPKSPRQVLQPEVAPAPPPRSQKARHPLVVVLNFFVMVAALILVAGGAAFYFGKQHYVAPGPLEEPATIVVAPGTGLAGISALLERHGVIDNRLLFSAAARLSGVQDQLKAGEYLFEPAVSMEQALDDLVTGRSVLHAITFPEGLTSEAIVARLRADPLLVGDIGEVPAEGTLLPETYKFTRGATREQVLNQMRQAHARLVEEIWARRVPGLPIETPAEFIALASIVEKETGRADERPRVAAVFINRLRQGMRLQSDPTVVYGIFGGAGKPPDRPIFQSDLQRQTPYNTYQIAGLPPTPIANPGRAALEAVANPSRTNELYFVADGSGGHVFAETLEDHNRNVERWRRIEAEAAAAREAASAAEADAETSAEGDGAPAEDAADATPAAADAAAAP
jgi:UPF0755 protein